MPSKRALVTSAVIGAAVVVAVVLVSLAYVKADNGGSAENNSMIFLATNLEERMAGSISVMKLTSHLPQVQSVSSLSL